MLRRCNAILTVLAFVLFTFVFGWQVWIASIQPHNLQQTNRAKQYSHEKILPKDPNEAIALYTELLAWFTGMLAIVSIGQGWFLYRSDKTARVSAEAIVAQMRAYVSVVSARIYGFDQDGESRVLIRIGNTGDTAAFDVTGESGVTIQNAEIFSFKGDLRPKDQPPIVRSRAGMGPKTTFDSFNAIPPLAADLKAAIRAGTHGIFAYGEIRYKDAIGMPRHTTYRLMYGGGAGTDPNGLFVTCEEGNDSN